MNHINHRVHHVRLELTTKRLKVFPTKEPQRAAVVAAPVEVSQTTLTANPLNDLDPKTMAECKQRSDWIKWKEAIEAELDSLRKRQVFSNVIPTPPMTYPVRFKWVFIRKRNENNEIVRYKARLVAQGFTQRLSINFNEAYSSLMNGITF
jgi:hypothetical protein